MAGYTLLIQLDEFVAPRWVLLFWSLVRGQVNWTDFLRNIWWFHGRIFKVFAPVMVWTWVAWLNFYYKRTFFAHFWAEVDVFNFVIKFLLLLIFQPNVMSLFVLNQTVFSIKPWVSGWRQIYVPDLFNLRPAILAYSVRRKGTLLNLFFFLLKPQLP